MKRRAEVLDDHQPLSSSDSPHMYPNGHVVLLQHLQNCGYIIYTHNGEWCLDRGKEDDLHSAFVETIQFLMIKNHSGPMDVTLPAVYDNTLHFINQYVYSAVSPFRTYLQLQDHDVFTNFVDNLTHGISTVFDEKNTSQFLRNLDQISKKTSPYPLQDIQNFLIQWITHDCCKTTTKAWSDVYLKVINAATIDDFAQVVDDYLKLL